jgi:hypothetical protein
MRQSKMGSYIDGDTYWGVDLLSLETPFGQYCKGEKLVSHSFSPKKALGKKQSLTALRSNIPSKQDPGQFQGLTRPSRFRIGSTLQLRVEEWIQLGVRIEVVPYRDILRPLTSVVAAEFGGDTLAHKGTSCSIHLTLKKPKIASDFKEAIQLRKVRLQK